jgi:hypothetical protein
VTTTKSQLREIFGEIGAFELTLMRQPSTLNGILEWLTHPDEVRVAQMAINQLLDERRRKAKHPTMCLLCDVNFLRVMPRMIVSARPTTRTGPGAIFFLCRTCDKKPEPENRILAKLHESVGMVTIEWGHA